MIISKIVVLCILYIIVGAGVHAIFKEVYNDGSMYNWVYKIPKVVLFISSYFIWPVVIAIALCVLVVYQFVDGIVWCLEDKPVDNNS